MVLDISQKTVFEISLYMNKYFPPSFLIKNFSDMIGDADLEQFPEVKICDAEQDLHEHMPEGAVKEGIGNFGGVK